MSGQSVLVVEDDAPLREALCETLGYHGYRVLEAGDGATALQLVESEPVGLVVSDVRMEPMDGYTLLQVLRRRHPAVPVLLMTAYGSVEQAVAAIRAGAVDYLTKPFDESLLLEKIERHLPASDEGPLGFVCEDPLTRRIAELAGRVARTEATVLITGESGTGKEVIARFIHRRSPRRDGPFVAVNCAAIPENMLEAMLFGYEKGAFTGAYQAHPGKFEQAEGGTLLLDEIGEMDLGLQAKLLRVLQEREVERLGGRKTIAVDVRVLATTNRDLAAEVRAGRFREDLFYRLNVFPIRMPPLSSRPGDIIALAERAVRRFADAGRPPPTLAETARTRLLEHRWPGNVRELENVIQRALILSCGDRIEA
jgi:two-component system response regulator FlrC